MNAQIWTMSLVITKLDYDYHGLPDRGDRSQVLLSQVQFSPKYPQKTPITSLKRIKYGMFFVSTVLKTEMAQIVEILLWQSQEFIYPT